MNLLAEIVQGTLDNWYSLSDRLWRDNLNAEALFSASSKRSSERTRGFFEQLLMRFASVDMLNRGLQLAPYDFLGISQAIPSVLAALVQDEQRQVKERVQAIQVLSHHGYRSSLVMIAQDHQRAAEVVIMAVEALELHSDWHAADQAWDFLLEHLEPGVRLRAANQGRSVTCLRALFRDETINLPERVEAAGALGRIQELSSDEFDTLVDWMNTAPVQTARLQAAYTIACLRRQPNALGKLRRYCYEYHHSDELRSLAIEYLGRLDRVDELRPLGRLSWVKPEQRLRVAEILREYGHNADAARSWLDLAQDENAPLLSRQAALRQVRSLYSGPAAAAIPPELLAEALTRLGSDGEPARLMRLEAARTLAQLGQVESARHIFLVLAHGSNPEAAVRRQAAQELRHLAIAI